MSKLKNIADIFSEEQFVENYIYLTNKSRGKYCTENALRKAYREGKADKLIKRLDPIAYHCEN